MPSHCCSHVARFDGTLLRDTYWSSESDGKRFKSEDIGKHITVTFVANEDQLEKINDYMEPKKYYPPDQIVDLNHPNSTRGNLYIRRGAKRDAKVMKAAIRVMIRRQERELEMAKNNIERLGVQLEDVETKPLDDVHLLGLPLS